MKMEYPNVPVDIVESENFRLDVCAGLRQQQRSIPPKYFYDAQGSALFEQICETAEYYLTRTETAILDQYSADDEPHRPTLRSGRVWLWQRSEDAITYASFGFFSSLCAHRYLQTAVRTN